jgi:hypothetical protein
MKCNQYLFFSSSFSKYFSSRPLYVKLNLFFFVKNLNMQMWLTPWSSSWEVSSEKIIRLPREAKAHYRDASSPPVDSILSQINQTHLHTLFNIPFNIILPFMIRSSKLYLFFSFPE